MGFVFADNGIVGIDIDEGYGEYGLWSDKAVDIIGKCRSYTEKSRSGRGFHILVKGDISFAGRNNLGGVEIYKAGRYFILTGETMLYAELKENQEALNYITEKYFTCPEKTSDNVSKFEQRIYRPEWQKPSEGKISLNARYPEIKTGSRNICLTSLAGYLHNAGFRKEYIFGELMKCNICACKPPLNKNEILTIVKSITRYKR